MAMKIISCEKLYFLPEIFLIIINIIFFTKDTKGIKRKGFWREKEKNFSQPKFKSGE